MSKKKRARKREEEERERAGRGGERIAKNLLKLVQKERPPERCAFSEFLYDVGNLNKPPPLLLRV